MAEDYRWDRLAEDLLELIEQLNLSRFVAGGVSMGAAVALWAACLAPTKVEALILGAPPTAWELRKEHGRRYEASAHIVEKYGIAELQRRVAKLPAPKIFMNHPERLHTNIAVEEKYLPFVFRGAATSDLPPLHRLRTLEQPTLVLAWAQDDNHPLGIAEQLANTLPAAELVVAESVADILQWPPIVARFLKNIGGA